MKERLENDIYIPLFGNNLPRTTLIILMIMDVSVRLTWHHFEMTLLINSFKQYTD